MTLDDIGSKCWYCGRLVPSNHILCRNHWQTLAKSQRRRMRRVIARLNGMDILDMRPININRVGLDLDLIRWHKSKSEAYIRSIERDRSKEQVAEVLRPFPDQERYMQVYAPGNDPGHPTTLTVLHFISGLYSVFQTVTVPLPPDREFLYRRPTDEEFARWTVQGDYADAGWNLTEILNAEQIKQLRGSSWVIGGQDAKND